MLAKNVGSTDRLIRLGLGAVLILGFIFTFGSALGWVLLVAGIAALGTGLLNFCGLYRIIGVSTCKIDGA